jgi:transglutaminase-like putative cysteine protease
VSNLEGTLYNAEGKIVQRLKRGDIKDLNAISDVSLFEDSRVKEAEFTYADYPFTVEFRYEITTSNTMSYPDWFPQIDENLAVESATFRVTLPAGQHLRYKTLNQLPEPERVENPAGQSYTWQLKHKKIYENEPYAPYATNLGPGVLTAPEEFELEARRGSMRTWQDLGRFLYQLNEGRDQLPEPLRRQVLELVGGETDVLKKIQKVYGFVQQHTRYVSIQLGIGGWQTIPASVVAEKGYGDCKALSNYTYALLKTVGIPSYWAVVAAGQHTADVLPDFPASRFNHMILCVPVAKDTVWLECTDQHAPAGYVGSFTDNRHALLLTPEGGKLVRTPVYRPADNRQNRSVTVRLTASGSATADVQTTYSGIQAETVESVMRTANPDDQRQWLYQQFKIPNFTISSFSFQERNAALPTIVERLAVQLPNCATRSGNRLFLVINQLSSDQMLPLQADHRTAELRLAYGYQDLDTVVCELPAGVGVEHVFEPIQITSRFGSYQISVKAEGNTVKYVRRLIIESGLYKPEMYAEYIDFRRKIAKADRMQILLKN